ncbi:MAG: hypothetical protein ACOH2A_10885 [Sphingobacteriaceae bacterium]
MKNLMILVCFFASYLTACTTNKPDQTSSQTEALIRKKRSVDSLITDQSLTILAKVVGKKELIIVKNRQYPAKLEVTYNLLKDGEGKIIYLAELPYSETSDWFIAYKSYFDPSGKLFAFQRLNNFMGSKCAPGAAMENLIRYYDDKAQVIDSTYTLMDTFNKPLQKDSCLFPYNFPYEVVQQLSDYKKQKGIVE